MQGSQKKQLAGGTPARKELAGCEAARKQLAAIFADFFGAQSARKHQSWLKSGWKKAYKYALTPQTAKYVQTAFLKFNGSGGRVGKQKKIDFIMGVGVGPGIRFARNWIFGLFNSKEGRQSNKKHKNNFCLLIHELPQHLHLYFVLSLCLHL